MEAANECALIVAVGVKYTPFSLTTNTLPLAFKAPASVVGLPETTLLRALELDDGC